MHYWHIHADKCKSHFYRTFAITHATDYYQNGSLYKKNLFSLCKKIFLIYIKLKFIITKNKKNKLDIDDVFKDYNTAEYKKLKKSDFNFEMYQKLDLFL